MKCAVWQSLDKSSAEMRKIMADNELYPEQKEEWKAEQTKEQGEDPVEGVRFGEQQGLSAEHEGHNETFPNEAVQHDSPYGNGMSQYNATYPNDVAYQNSRPYQNGADLYNSYQTDHQTPPYYNGAYSGAGDRGYNGAYQQYNGSQSYQNAYQDNGRMELEEPVKISEWVLAMVLMMIPCVNIIMMFVWAFSSTEKKSKSNFFKAYLIFFGISMGVLLLIWIAIVFFAMLMY